MKEDIRERAERYRDETAKFLAEIVSIPSLSGQERGVVERIGAEMRAVGFDEVRVDGLGSVIGRIGNGKHVIAMDAHIDTVDVGNPANWTFEPHRGHVRDGKVWGRGAADQKGGMASMVTAGRILKELGAKGDWTLLVTGTVMEEDCDGLCWDHLVRVEGLRPEVCVITEPTGCRIYRGQRGRMEIEIEVAGRSAHGSAPERGVNAIYKMAPVVAGLEKLNERLRRDEFLGKGTVVVSHILGDGPSLCAVADRCRTYLDRRLTAGETRDSALAEIREVLAGVEAKVTVPRYEQAAYTGKIFPMEKYFPTWVTPAEHAAVRAAERTYRGLFGGEPLVDKWTFSTNGVAIMGLHGIPCVGFGPGYEEQAHAPDEWCPVEHLVQAAAFYAGFVGEYAEAQ
ncbi:MAG: YgeY family selenium metabolism-linked hydrolase [Deltaproteobacteria bacterium]|nr:YgeY family selenium metabolism-linked hydrolase [Deltaproteobacteria bacterium]